jgi:uncharacterized protein
LELRWNWLAGLIISVLFQTLLTQQVSAKTELETKVIFQKTQIKIKNKTINVELAESSEQQEYGLMFRTHLPKNSGMLFIFKDQRTRSFWMKNTLIDLSIAYIDQNQKIIDIQEMKATSSLDLEIPSYPSKQPAAYALEMNSHWFASNKIKVGDSFVFLKPTRR